jgi:hypothetical protein
VFKIIAISLSLFGLILGSIQTASACTNPYSRRVVSYMPNMGAENIPLNAKVIIDWAELHYSEGGLGHFNYQPGLAEKDSGVEVEVEITEEMAGTGWPERGVLVITPSSDLKPNTTYHLTDSSGTPQGKGYSFTTGTSKQTDGGSFSGVTNHTVTEKAEASYALCEPTGFVGACPTYLQNSWTYPVHALITFDTLGDADSNASTYHYRLLRVEEGVVDVLLDSISLSPSTETASFDLLLSGTDSQCVKVIAESITGAKLDNDSVVCFSRDDATVIERNTKPDISNYYCDPDDGQWKQKATAPDAGPEDPPGTDAGPTDPNFDPNYDGVNIRTRGCSATPGGNAPLHLAPLLLLALCVIRRR